MSGKVFLAGMACGAALVLAVSWLIPDAHLADGNDVVSSESISPGPDSVSGMPGATDATVPEVVTAQGERFAETGGMNAGPERREGAMPNAPEPLERTASGENGSAINPSISEENNEAVARDTEWALEQRRAELDAEARDDSWAYYMEETLTQYLARHPGIVEFDVSYVECRTSFCQLQVIGFDASTEPTWSRIMYDLRQALPGQTTS